METHISRRLFLKIVSGAIAAARYGRPDKAMKRVDAIPEENLAEILQADHLESEVAKELLLGDWRAYFMNALYDSGVLPAELLDSVDRSSLSRQSIDKVFDALGSIGDKYREPILATFDHYARILGEGFGPAIAGENFSRFKIMYSIEAEVAHTIAEELTNRGNDMTDDYLPAFREYVRDMSRASMGGYRISDEEGDLLSYWSTLLSDGGRPITFGDIVILKKKARSIAGFAWDALNSGESPYDHSKVREKIETYKEKMMDGKTSHLRPITREAPLATDHALPVFWGWYDGVT